MSDTLATINVDQLSSAVNAIVQAADSTQPVAPGPRHVQGVHTSNQVLASNVQLQVPIQNLSSNTVTIGNNAVPVMLVRVAQQTNQLSNQVPSLPLAFNQVQAVPVVRPSAPTGANIVGQIGNMAIALQPTKSVTLTQPAQVQTITLPTINQNTSSSNFQGNQNTIATDLLNLSAAQNVTFGNILSVQQQKPRSDVLVLNPTGVQLNANNAVGRGNVPMVQSTSNTYPVATNNPTSQSPSINLNLNINLPTSGSLQQPQQNAPATIQTIQTTPIKSSIPAAAQPLGQARITYQIPQQPVFQQILQPTMIQSGSIVPSSSVVSIPVISPNNVIQQQQHNSGVMVQMAPIVQALPASACASSHPVQMSVIQPTMTTQTLHASQANSRPFTQMAPFGQIISSQNGSIQIVNSQPIQTCQSASQVVTTQAVQQNSLTAEVCSASQPSSSQGTETVTHTEQYSSSQNEPTSEMVVLSGPQGQLAQEIDSLTTWPNLHIMPSSTTTTLTSSSPHNAVLQSTNSATIQSESQTAPSIQLQIACEDSSAVQGSIPLTSVTPHLTSILSDLTQQITTSSDASQDLTQHQFAHPDAAHHQNTSLHLSQITDPVSTATIVAGVSAEDIEGLDISIPASLSGLSVTAADFLQEEIHTGVWCTDCNKYNSETCTKHGPIVFIRDSIIESRAKLTLPKVLEMKSSKIASKFVGVFATDTIQVRTQFGPLQGKVVSRDDKFIDVDSHLVWRIYSEGTLAHYLDTTDVRVSNWMMFVKQARTEKDQNLVAHQQGSTIYFTTTKTVETGDELYVWYCRDYALWRGVPTKPEGTFPCHLCPVQFTRIAQLTNHIKYTHANLSQRRWKCSMCERAFTTQSKLNVHILVHMGVRPHKCEHCDKTFTDPSNLRTHRLIHSDVKKFACSLCDKSFRQKAHLETHLVTHTGEKKLKCKFCDLMFARPNDVTQHMYKHTKEKEVSCETCGRKFWRIGHLKKHRKLHTGERDYHCTKCTKSFVTSYHLKRHTNTCKGPHYMKLAATKGRKSDREDDVVAIPSPTKPVKIASSRGRLLKPKPTFTIEARPSRLRKKGGTSSVMQGGKKRGARSGTRKNVKSTEDSSVTVKTSVCCTQTDMSIDPM